MENWDFDHTSSVTESTGKIFGNRGRGFGALSSTYKHNYQPKIGGNYSNGNEKSTNRFNKVEQIDGQDRWKEINRPFQTGKPKKLKKIKCYVPDDPTENDNEIFGSCIASGINFNKYDDIQVAVSGENPPQAITSFDAAGLSPFIVDLIHKCKYNKPTPIQKFAIPIVLSGRDMMACAQTGSGKTAAFLIPIIDLLLQNHKDTETADKTCKPQVVILSPTRELTIQIFNEARKFSRGSDLITAVIYGGTSVQHQVEKIQQGCNILVATPGRLLDFVKRGLIKFYKTRFLVLDEADQLLDRGFLPQIKDLFLHSTMLAASERQTLMFSATFPEEVQQLAIMFLKNYLLVTVGIVGSACSDVEQNFFSVTKHQKRDKLVELLSEQGCWKCLVFVKNKRTTDFIATFLCEKNFPATSIHGDREQKQREEALKDFKSGKMDILVATSVVARGLDIKNVAHVINFDLPSTIDEYIHRIGRTGRVGNRGRATSFFDPSCDGHLAPGLIRVLTQSGQEIPDFLQENEACENIFTVSSEFGGRNNRNNSLGDAREEIFENEEW